MPSELAVLRGLIQQCANAEDAINPQADNFYAYLTLQRSLVLRGEKMRTGGPHSDSIQGPRIQPKVTIEHGYSAVDSDPTRFYVQGFNLDGLDADQDWLNSAFEEQADITQSVQFHPGDVVLFDAYCVHDGVEVEHTAIRTFARLIYSVRQFDRLGNTVNKLFDYDWDFKPRPIPSTLNGLPKKHL